MKPYFALVAIALGGCISGQGQVDVSANNAATFPGVPAGAGGQRLSGESLTTDAYVTVDVQKDLASLSALGTLSGAISKNSVSGTDLSLIHHIKATISAQDGKPPQLASDVDVPEKSTEVDLPMLISDSQTLEFLTKGKVTFHFYLTGDIPERSLTLTHTIVAHIDVNVKGPISKL